MAEWRASGRAALRAQGGDRRSNRVEAEAAFLLARVAETPDVRLAELREVARAGSPCPGQHALAHLRPPADRSIDGIDQSGFVLGDSETSARDGFPVFVADRPEAVKWKNDDGLTSQPPEGIILVISMVYVSEKVGRGIVLVSQPPDRTLSPSRVCTQSLSRLRVADSLWSSSVWGWVWRDPT